MSSLIMPKSIALWFLQNTSMTARQIADFCGIHILDVEFLAKRPKLHRPLDPVAQGYTTKEDIALCEGDHTLPLRKIVAETNRKIKKRYVSLTKRHLKAHVAVWMVQHYKEYSKAQIARFLGSTSAYLKKMEENVEKIEAKHPVASGFCTAAELAQFEASLK